MVELADFLATIPIFEGLDREQLRRMAPLFRSDRYPTGSIILRQGSHSQCVFLLRSGELAVRVQRAHVRETVAYLHAPAVFGELSFITGRACSADVEVLVDAEVLSLSKDRLGELPEHRDSILRGMMTLLAERLHTTVTRGLQAPELPVILLRNHRNWPAPFSFGSALGCSLARQTARETLIVNVGGGSGAGQERKLAESCFLLELEAGEPENLRAQLAEDLGSWKKRFENILLNPVGSQAEQVVEKVMAFADYQGYLLGPDDPEPGSLPPRHFVVQEAEKPTLAKLSGRRQLIWQARESEQAHLAGKTLDPRFQRTVDSIARHIADLQVGLALGGGAAWGWAHIGVLAVLQEAGLPVDVIAGCSMGSVIGSLRCTGRDVERLQSIAHYWKGRTRRFLELRIWRMHLLREKTVRNAFESYFGDRAINQTEIPFWVNAVDVRTGREVTISDGPIVDALRASIALPGLLPPCERGRYLLVDAGVMNPVPVALVNEMGCRYAVAVNAMVPLEAQEVSSRYPLNIFDVMFRCMRITGHEIGQVQSEAAAAAVLTPRLEDISMLEFVRSQEIIEAGEEVARENLAAILAGYDNLKKSAPRVRLSREV